MEVRFQMINSTNPNTIAVVKNEVDIKAFRRDPGWYEVTTPEPTPVKQVEPQEPVKPKKVTKKENE